VACGTNGFVAVGVSGVILHSYDGTSWTYRATPYGGPGYTWNNVIFVNSNPGFYFTVGNGIAAYSTDGLYWTAVAIGNSSRSLDYHYTYVDGTNNQFLNVEVYSNNLKSTIWTCAASTAAINSINNWYSTLIAQGPNYSISNYGAVKEYLTNFTVMCGDINGTAADLTFYNLSSTGFLTPGYSSYSVAGNIGQFTTGDSDKFGNVLIIGYLDAPTAKGIINGASVSKTTWTSSKLPARGNFVRQTILPSGLGNIFLSILYHNNYWYIGTGNGKIIRGTGNPGTADGIVFSTIAVPTEVGTSPITGIASRAQYTTGSATGNIVAVGFDGKIIISTNGGSSFLLVNDGDTARGVVNY
jgi:hypothetical protein